MADANEKEEVCTSERADAEAVVNGQSRTNKVSLNDMRDRTILMSLYPALTDRRRHSKGGAGLHVVPAHPRGQLGEDCA